jgi:hypothetical protein
VRAVLDPEVTGGDYLGPAAFTKGPPVHVPATRASRSPRLAAALWPLLENAAAQPFPL